MKVIVLAAGYGTRMGELTKNTPKPLLPVGGKAIVEHLFEKLTPIESITHYYIISNGKFYQSFKEWELDFHANRNGHITLDILNDHSTCNENRLGAIGDIQLVLNTVSFQDDVIITAGDNLYDFDLLEYYRFFQKKNCDCIAVIPIHEPEKLKRTGVVEVDSDFRVIGFEEKPAEPKSNFACPPIYFFKQATLGLVKDYLKSGNNPDAPGHFISWLHKQRPVYAYQIKGQRYDVGNPETYQKVNEIYASKK